MCERDGAAKCATEVDSQVDSELWMITQCSSLIDGAGKTVAAADPTCQLLLGEALDPITHGTPWKWKAKSKKAEKIKIRIQSETNLETLQKLWTPPKLALHFNCSVIKRQLHKIKNKSWFRTKWLRQRRKRREEKKSSDWKKVRRAKKAKEDTKIKND